MFFIQHCCFSQDEHLIDSLQTISKTAKQDTIKANILYELSKIYSGNNPDKAMDYAKQALELSEKLGYKKEIGNAYNSMGVMSRNKGDYPLALEFLNKALLICQDISDKSGTAFSNLYIGITYFEQGKYPEALKSYFTSLRMYEEIKDEKGIADSYNCIGIIYYNQHNFPEALKNFFTALKLREKIGDKNRLPSSYTNIGEIYREQQNYPEALKNYFASLKISEEIGDKRLQAICFANIGNIYTLQGNYSEALKKFFSALTIYEDIGDKSYIAWCYHGIGNIYMLQKKNKAASLYLDKALSLSIEIGALEETETSYKDYTSLDQALGNYKQALEHYKLFITTRDSIFNQENIKKITQQQMQYDFDKKESLTKSEQQKKDAVAQKELQKQKLMRNGFVGGFSIVLLFAGVFFTQRNKITKGKKRSDELLLNILPEEVAEELKQKGSAEAKQFDYVTVMFTDFKNFTQISEKLSPTELVAEIHSCFKAFDNIITKHNIEKIKTIGDSYMCAGGLPVANKTNATDVVSAAMEIQHFMQEHLQERKKENKEPFEIRIGVHTGAVVAGIVGVKKFAYDIWGDTVNIASRMESSGEAGNVNISGSTYELVKDKFNCTHRGKIQAKNKGDIDMYFVEPVS
jgi:adenylate cyclase